MGFTPFINLKQIALQYNVSLLMTLHDAKQQLIFQLMEIYDDNEAAAITDIVMEHLTGWQRIDRVFNGELEQVVRDINEQIWKKTA